MVRKVEVNIVLATLNKSTLAFLHSRVLRTVFLCGFAAPFGATAENLASPAMVVAGEQTAVISPDDPDAVENDLAISEETLKAWQPLKLVYLDFPPLTYTKDGKPTGFYLDLAGDVLREAGLEFEMVQVPASRLYGGMERGEAHLFLGPKRQGSSLKDGSVLYGSSVLAVVSANIYRLAGTEERTFADLSDTSLITIQGYSYLGLMPEMRRRKNLTLLRANTHESALKLLKFGRAPYLFDYARPFQAAAKTLPDLAVSVTPVLSISVVFVVSKSIKHPKFLLALMEQSLEAVLARRNMVIAELGP